MIERHYRPVEVGELVGMSADTIQRYCKAGAIRHVRPPGGRAILIPESAVAEWLQAGERPSNLPGPVPPLRRIA